MRVLELELVSDLYGYEGGTSSLKVPRKPPPRELRFSSMLEGLRGRMDEIGFKRSAWLFYISTDASLVSGRVARQTS